MQRIQAIFQCGNWMISVEVKVTWHVAKYGNPYSELVLCIYPIQSAHTQQWTHTHREHTPGAVGSHFYAAVPREQLGVQSWYWRWRERCTFTPPTYNPCRTWDSNSQPLGYESDSLTIRPRLPQSRVACESQKKAKQIWQHFIMFENIC